MCPQQQVVLSSPGPDLLIYSVAQMRDLLLAYGATNSRALREQWRRRQVADVNERARQANMHYDPR